MPRGRPRNEQRPQQEIRRQQRLNLREEISRRVFGDQIEEKKEEIEHLRRLKKPIERPKGWTKFDDVAFPKKNYNYQADLLDFNKFAVTDDGYGYLLTIIDIYSGRVDFEPIKNKSGTDTLRAIKTIFRRGILQKPKKTFSTDPGREFNNNEIKNYLRRENIYHKIARAARHSQQAKIERFNRTLKEYLIQYIEEMEERTGEDFNNWTDILPLLREKLNELTNIPDQDPYTYPFKKMKLLELKQKNKLNPKFNVGDLVHINLEKPYDLRGRRRTTIEYRTGDFHFERNPRRITKVLNFSGYEPYRYMVEGIKDVSFTERQLVKARN